MKLLRNYCTWQQPLREDTGGLPQYKLQRALDYIHAYLERNLSLEAITTELAISHHYFCRLFKQSMGITPYQYILQQQIEQANQLLKKEEAIADIALQCGFADQNHLTRMFRRLTGSIPKSYRKQTRCTTT